MINNIMECIVLDRNKYDMLIKENKELKEELQKINADNDLLRQNQINHLLTIEILKNENKELKDEIIRLKENNIILNQRIDTLEKENKQLKENNIILHQRIDKLNNTIDKMNNKAYINKLVYACQDLNSTESLEKIFKIPFNKLMSKLRSNRKYIFNDDDIDVILCKEKVLYDILKNLDDAKRQLLNKKIGAALVDEIINFLSLKPYDAANLDDYNEIIEWFDE